MTALSSGARGVPTTPHVRFANRSVGTLRAIGHSSQQILQTKSKKTRFRRCRCFCSKDKTCSGIRFTRESRKSAVANYHADARAVGASDLGARGSHAYDETAACFSLILSGGLDIGSGDNPKPGEMPWYRRMVCVPQSSSTEDGKIPRMQFHS